MQILIYVKGTYNFTRLELASNINSVAVLNKNIEDLSILNFVVVVVVVVLCYRLRFYLVILSILKLHLCSFNDFLNSIKEINRFRKQMVHGKSHTSDIRMTYEYRRVTYG